jgi:hypothetical protein
MLLVSAFPISTLTGTAVAFALLDPTAGGRALVLRAPVVAVLLSSGDDREEPCRAARPAPRRRDAPTP